MKDYVYIETYGCAANQNNSEILAGLLKQAGYEMTGNEDIAEIIIVNTCVVKGKTENKIKRRIQDLSGEERLVVITGCMPETDLKALEKLNGKALLLGTHNVRAVVKLIKDFKENKLTEEKKKQYLKESEEQKLLVPKIPKNRLISITQISEGCLGNCTYCKTRLAKGKLFSYDMDDIVKSVESDLTNGAKEVWITSQDNASYGLDKAKKQELPALLKKILGLKHRFRLRLGMMDPNFLFPILEDIIGIYKDPKMFKFLHVPIQSASDSVLKHMKRPYKIAVAEKIIEKFRKEFPDITIATDIITGYPTESEKDHEKNLEFLEKYRPDVFNLSKFSKHKGTEAEKLESLTMGTISKRATGLMDIHRKTALENKKKFLDKEIDIFVDDKKEGFYLGRDVNYNIVMFNSRENVLGKNIKVKIKNVGVHHLLGETI